MKYLFAILFVLFIACPAHAAAINQLQVISTNGSYALSPPIYVNVKVLAANTAESFTIPTGANGLLANYVSFSSNCDFYANHTTTAAVPAADVTNGTGSELNPLIRIIPRGTASYSVISATTCIITASFYM